jgi:hypothetical protein
VLPSLLEFLGSAVLVAHNARFDVSFLRAALAAHRGHPAFDPVVAGHRPAGTPRARRGGAKRPAGHPGGAPACAHAARAPGAGRRPRDRRRAPRAHRARRAPTVRPPSRTCRTSLAPPRSGPSARSTSSATHPAPPARTGSSARTDEVLYVGKATGPAATTADLLRPGPAPPRRRPRPGHRAGDLDAHPDRAGGRGPRAARHPLAPAPLQPPLQAPRAGRAPRPDAGGLPAPVDRALAPGRPPAHTRAAAPRGDSPRRPPRRCRRPPDCAPAHRACAGRRITARAC